MNGCVHWWKIREARGPTSKGRCKRCGARREFSNGFWYDVPRKSHELVIRSQYGRLDPGRVMEGYRE